MVFAALAMVRSEILWYFCHVGIMVGKSKGTRVIPIEMVCHFFISSKTGITFFIPPFQGVSYFHSQVPSFQVFVFPVRWVDGRVGLHWSSVFMTTAGYCRSNHWFPVGWNGSTYPPCFQIYSRLVLCRNSGYRCLYIDLPKTLSWLLWVRNPNPTPTSEADEVSE